MMCSNVLHCIENKITIIKTEMKIIHNQRLWKAYCCVVVVKVLKHTSQKLQLRLLAGYLGLIFSLLT